MKVLLNLDFDGDKVYRTAEQMLLKAFKEDLPTIISPLEDYKQPASSKLTIMQVEAYGLKELDERTLNNLTGLYTNMGTYYINKYYTIIHKYKDAIEKYELAYKNKDINVIENLRKEFYPCDMFDSIESFNAKLQSDFIRLEKFYDYKITIIRIAQAGEIDFPKHGVRFPLPKNVVTKNKVHWLDPLKFESKQQSLREKGEPLMEVLDTPFERLFNHLNARADEIRSANGVNTVDLNQYFLNFDNIDKQEFLRILPMVQSLSKKYNDGITGLYKKKNFGGYNKNNSSTDKFSSYAKNKKEKLENTNVEYDMFFNMIQEEANNITNDIKAFASACYYVTYFQNEKGHGSKFPFIVAYEGLLANLADYNFNNVRVTPVETIDELGINLEGEVIVKDSVSILTTTGEIMKEFDCLSLNDGSYNLFNFRGKHYLNVPYILTDEDKETILSHYCNKDLIDNMNKSKPVQTKVRANKNVLYDLTLIGNKNVGITLEEAYQLIISNNNRISFKQIFVQSKSNGGEQIEVPYVGLAVGNHDLGTIKRFERYKVIDNDLIILDDFINHIAQVVDMKIKYSKKTKKPCAIQLKVSLQTSNIQKFDNELNDIHKLCNLSSWYWNRTWLTFANFGVNFEKVEIANKNPEVNHIFARIKFTKGSNSFYAYVIKTEKDIDVSYIECIENNQKVIDMHLDLKATFLRAVDYTINEVKVEDMKAKEMEIEISKALDSKKIINGMHLSFKEDNEKEHLRKEVILQQNDSYKNLNDKRYLKAKMSADNALQAIG